MATKPTLDKDSSVDKLPPPNLVWRFALAACHENVRMSRAGGTGQSAIAVSFPQQECVSVQNLPYIHFQQALYHHLSDYHENYIDHIGTFNVNENKLLIEVHFTSTDQVKQCLDGLEKMIINKALRSTFSAFIRSFEVPEFEILLVIQSNIESRLRIVTRENALYAFSIVYTERPSVALLHLRNPEIYTQIKAAYDQLLIHFPNFLGEIDGFSAFDDSEILESRESHKDLAKESHQPHIIVPRGGPSALTVNPQLTLQHVNTDVTPSQVVDVSSNNTVTVVEGSQRLSSPHSENVIIDGHSAGVVASESVTAPHPTSNSEDGRCLDQDVSEIELGNIAPKIPPKYYKLLGNQLGLDMPAISRIELDSKGKSLDFILGILTEANKLDCASRQNFAAALLHCNLHKVAKILDSSLNIPPCSIEPSGVLPDVVGHLHFYDKTSGEEDAHKQQPTSFWKKFQRELQSAIEKALQEYYDLSIHSITVGSLIIHIKLRSFYQAKMICADIASRKLTDRIEVQMKALGFTGVLATELKIDDVEVVPGQCYNSYVKALLSSKPQGSHPIKLLPLLATLSEKSQQKLNHSQPPSVYTKGRGEHTTSIEVNENARPDIDTKGLYPETSPKHEKTLTDVIIHGTVEQIQGAIGECSVLKEFQKGFLLLHVAAHYGKSEAIKVLVSHGAEIEAKTATTEKVTSLHLASYAGHLKAVEILVELGADLEAPSANGSTPLRLAASQRNGLVTECLLEKGANSNAQCNEGKTPLYAAIVRGHQGNVKLLLLHGADMTIPTVTGETAIHHAIAYGNAEILSVLVSANPQALLHSNVMEFEPPLISAVKLQKVQHVKILLKARVDPNVCNNDQMSPLTIAACLENFEIIELLVKNGAELTLTFPPFGTALHTVAVEGKVNGVRKLLKMGMDPNILDHEGTTPLRRAVENKQASVAAVLLDNGANIHVECPGDELPLLHKAAKRNDTEVLELLIEHGADPYETGIKGGTAMMAAAANGSGDAVDMLSAYSGLINIANKFGATPLMVAINKRNYDCALHLLKHKPNVSVSDQDGYTALHTCIAFRAPENVVQAILCCDTTITAPASNSVTPIMLACKHGFFELVEVMLKKNQDLFRRFPDLSPILLCSAVGSGSTRTVEALLQYGAKADAIHPHRPLTALHLVCSQSNTYDRMLQLILDHNPNLNTLTELGSALTIAVVSHRNSFVAMLLAHKADPNILSIPEMVPPLIVAAESNNVEAVRLILQHGGRIDYALPHNGFTALHKSASYNYIEVAKLLITKLLEQYGNEAHIKLDQPSKEGYTPLHVAVSAGSQDVFALLIENSCDINAQDFAGVTPLMRAISEGRNEMALMILELGADFRICANDGVNALHVCARVGSATITKRILELGANPDVQEAHGITPLLLSIVIRKTNVARVLIESGASVNLADNKKNTPLHEAAEINDGDIVRILLEHGADPLAQNTDRNKPKDLTESKNIEKMIAMAAKNVPQSQSIIMEEVEYRLAGEGHAAMKNVLYNTEQQCRDDIKK